MTYTCRGHKSGISPWFDGSFGLAADFVSYVRQHLWFSAVLSARLLQDAARHDLIAGPSMGEFCHDIFNTIQYFMARLQRNW